MKLKKKKSKTMLGIAQCDEEDRKGNMIENGK